MCADTLGYFSTPLHEKSYFSSPFHLCRTARKLLLLFLFLLFFVHNMNNSYIYIHGCIKCRQKYNAIWNFHFYLNYFFVISFHIIALFLWKSQVYTSNVPIELQVNFWKNSFIFRKDPWTMPTVSKSWTPMRDNYKSIKKFKTYNFIA